MTKRKLFYMVTGIVLFIFGLYIGYGKGIKRYSDAQSQIDHLIINDLQIKLKLLIHLRSGEITASEEMLEYLTDNDIQYLYARLKNMEHNSQANNEIINAIIEAKEYRDKYPMHRLDKHYSKNIDDILQKVGE